MISKALIDLTNSAKFQEEFMGVIHGLVLHLYTKQGIEIPNYLKNYKFKNKNPWECDK